MGIRMRLGLDSSSVTAIEVVVLRPNRCQETTLLSSRLRLTGLHATMSPATFDVTPHQQQQHSISGLKVLHQQQTSLISPQRAHHDLS